jgi:hypothetical protein
VPEGDLERIDVIEDRDPPPQHFADDVAPLDAIGEDHRGAGGTLSVTAVRPTYAGDPPPPGLSP